MDNWIDVNESVPELEEWVLCYVPDRSYGNTVVSYLRQFTTSKNSRYLEWNDCDDLSIRPTHWMPLPQPPKQKP